MARGYSFFFFRIQLLLSNCRLVLEELVGSTLPILRTLELNCDYIEPMMAYTLIA